MQTADPEAGNASSMRFRSKQDVEPIAPQPPPAAPAEAKEKKNKLPRWLANAKRENFWSVKTRPSQWATLRSRWRFFEGLFFYLGPPVHMLRRVWPPMILNACVFSLVAADHLLEAVSVARQQEAMSKAMGHGVPASSGTAGSMGRRLSQAESGNGIVHPSSSPSSAPSITPRSLFPPLSSSVSSSLDPVFRLSIFVVSLLLTLRVGRAYERWWQARTSFQQLGSLALALTQRAEAWFCGAGGGGGGAGEGRAERASLLLAEDIARWSVVWQCSVLQLITGSPRLHPAARMLLKPAELELYDAAPKGRQLAASRVTQLLVNGPKLAGARDDLNPVVVDNLVRSGLAAAGGCTSIKLQCLPAAVTITSTGVTEAFLLLYPLSALSVGGKVGRTHDASVGSVSFTLAIQLVLYLFVCLLFLGMAEVSGSLEDPYTGGHLPLEDMARTTVRDVANARREAAMVRRLGLGGEGHVGIGGKGGDGEVGVFETVDWSGAEALCKRVKG